MRVITKKYYENRHPLLGRTVHHDNKSLEFIFPTAGLQIKSVVHQRHIPIMDQGQIGCCVGDASIGNLATTPLFETLPTALPYSLDQAGALRLYSDDETLDGDGPFPPADNGTSGLTSAKVLKRASLISAYQHVFDVDSALRALSVTPFMFGTDWQERMFTTDKDGRVYPYGKVVGGHEILCREFDLNGSKLWFDNSWGLGWGLQGRFYLTVDDFAHLLKKDGDIIVLIPLAVGVTGGWNVKKHHKRHHRHRHHHHRVHPNHNP